MMQSADNSKAGNTHGVPVFEELDEVFHVGTLDPESRTDRASLEAFLLSVSIHPEEWSSIARCGGPTWSFHRKGALWLDALAIDDVLETDIRNWGVTRGYAREETVWRAWFFDGEADDWGYMTFLDEERAWQEADDPEGYDLDEIPSGNGEIVEPVAAVALTAAGMSALERWHDPADGFDGLIMLWAREVLLPDHPDLMGIWWWEEENPQSLSCPRGGIFPERLGAFEISDDCGNAPPVTFVEALGRSCFRQDDAPSLPEPS